MTAMRARVFSQSTSASGFTLIEMLLAIAAAAILLAALYGLFARAIKLRDSAEQHIREARLRAHALAVMKNDLANARFVSDAMRGGFLAQQTNPYSSPFPGYLRFTATTGRDTIDMQYGDTQEIEYYIDSDTQSSNTQAGVLVRTVDRVLLADVPQITTEERLLTNIQSMELEFFDGTDWQTSWDTSTTDTGSNSTATSSSSSTGGSSSGTYTSTITNADGTTTTSPLPLAVRIRLIPFADRGQQTPPPIELLVPWGAQKQ
jgi:prepilin-type N-terminal cleavage/methylation domain-containing protein